MRLLVEKLQSLGIGWNERVLDDGDAGELCRRLDITLDERPMTVKGFYYRLLERDFIAIDSALQGPVRFAVLFHELAHCLFHAPVSGPIAGFHHIGRITRQEREADMFALCAVIPLAMIETHDAAELVADGIGPELVEARFEIYRVHGI
jgi:hypothetical protein